MKRRYLFYVVCLSLMIVTPVVVLLLYPLPRAPIHSQGEGDFFYYHGFSIILLIEVLLLITLLSYKYRNKAKKEEVAPPILLFLLLLSILSFSYMAKGEDYRLLQAEAKMHDDIIDIKKEQTASCLSLNSWANIL